VRNVVSNSSGLEAQRACNDISRGDGGSSSHRPQWKLYVAATGGAALRLGGVALTRNGEKSILTTAAALAQWWR
jgi:hypothetical protein